MTAKYVLKGPIFFAITEPFWLMAKDCIAYKLCETKGLLESFFKLARSFLRSSGLLSSIQTQLKVNKILSTGRNSAACLRQHDFGFSLKTYSDLLFKNNFAHLLDYNLFDWANWLLVSSMSKVFAPLPFFC